MSPTIVFLREFQCLLINMEIQTVRTYNASIYAGLKIRGDGAIFSFEEAERLIQSWVNEISYCVSVTQTKYIYKGGNEPGLIVGFITYPRFPDPPERIKKLALELAEKIMLAFRQYRVSVVFPDETVMLSNPDFGE